VGDRRTIQKRLDKARYRFYQQEPESVAAAAKHFELDPNDARQREKLLWLLADVVFGRGKKGRPKGSSTSWDSKRLCSLAAIYAEKKYENPKLSDAKIAKLIKDEHEEFKNDDAQQIRQRLRWAEEVYHEWSEYADGEAYSWAREHGEVEDGDWDD
jgi:hypothetical protein